MRASGTYGKCHLWQVPLGIATYYFFTDLSRYPKIFKIWVNYRTSFGIFLNSKWINSDLVTFISRSSLFHYILTQIQIPPYYVDLSSLVKPRKYNSKSISRCFWSMCILYCGAGVKFSQSYRLRAHTQNNNSFMVPC